MSPNQPQIIFTDLDGTLLNSKRAVSPTNLATFRKLGESGVTRVIATGRSLYSFNRTMPADFPADYLIFSSGAGILDLTSKALLFSAHHNKDDILFISRTLDDHQADHMIHHEVPENHRFIYRHHSVKNPDFIKRISLYLDFAQRCVDTTSMPAYSAQIIAVLPPNDGRFNIIKDSLNGYQVTRTTSPLDHSSLWMEVYPAGIHKGSAAAWLCSRLNICCENSVGIGNDYNDIDLLDFTARSFIVDNSPKALLEKYTPTPSNNDNNGFSEAVHAAMNWNFTG